VTSLRKNLFEKKSGDTGEGGVKRRKNKLLISFMNALLG